MPACGQDQSSARAKRILGRGSAGPAAAWRKPSGNPASAVMKTQRTRSHGKREKKVPGIAMAPIQDLRKEDFYRGEADDAPDISLLPMVGFPRYSRFEAPLRT